ncbi:sigma-54-dependent transcriptional regulator [Sphingomonas sp. HT-1]|uniref:sigma-54-dependent transcriptional regulator n=1 Tax=unclassified Sphingomonas TaxID=196159 RepID=UPI000300FBAF|nr:MULTISPECIES: sigma-54 dependent transcriptional regulator [unclassified Sphingomonas]KTF70594.1 RNA polymerase subunit sigma-54 [Sphingomonas sp. WG]
MASSIRMLLIGAPGSEFRLAAELARSAGAEVAMADTPQDGLIELRQGGADLVMIDVEADIAGFMQSIRAERFTIAVLACGIDAPAERAVAAIRAGARDYVPLPPQRELIAAAIASVVERKAPAWIGGHPALARALSLAAAVAPSGAPVLITGEKGSGKEVTARAVHDASGRAQPMLVAECAGVAPDVLESELFGHEAGAFPGAVARRIGRLEKAGHGTILLREVGVLSPALQAKLHDVLQKQQFRRLAGDDVVPFHARLIATTSIDLDALVNAGAFRADLLVRLGLVRIEVPPLRERGDDIIALARYFAKRHAEADGMPPRAFTDEAMALIQRHSWPGNIRELDETVHRAILLGRAAAIQPGDLVRADGTPLAELTTDASALDINSLVGRTVEEVERELILQTLERCHGNRTSASNILGISVRTMRNKLRSFIEAGIAVSPAP